MPLVTCPDCSASVSDAAPACPKCGRPLAGGAPPKGLSASLLRTRRDGFRHRRRRVGPKLLAGTSGGAAAGASRAVRLRALPRHRRAAASSCSGGGRGSSEADLAAGLTDVLVDHERDTAPLIRETRPREPRPKAARASESADGLFAAPFERRGATHTYKKGRDLAASGIPITSPPMRSAAAVSRRDDLRRPRARAQENPSRSPVELCHIAPRHHQARAEVVGRALLVIETKAGLPDERVTELVTGDVVRALDRQAGFHCDHEPIAHARQRARRDEVRGATDLGSEDLLYEFEGRGRVVIVRVGASESLSGDALEVGVVLHHKMIPPLAPRGNGSCSTSPLRARRAFLDSFLFGRRLLSSIGRPGIAHARREVPLFIRRPRRDAVRCGKGERRVVGCVLAGVSTGPGARHRLVQRGLRVDQGLGPSLHREDPVADAGAAFASAFGEILVPSPP